MSDELVVYDLWNNTKIHHKNYTTDIPNQYGRGEEVCRQFFEDVFGYLVVDTPRCGNPFEGYGIPRKVGHRIEEVSGRNLSMFSDVTGHPDQIHFRTLPLTRSSDIMDVFYVECKRKTNDLKENQINWIKRFKDDVPIRVVYVNPENQSHKVERLFMGEAK